MQYRRFAYLLFLLPLCVIPRAGYAQTATYHLHQETSAITPGVDQLLVAGPDSPSAAFTIPLNGKAAGEYLIKEFETQAGDPNSSGTIPAGSTLSFSLFMRKTAGVGTVFPRAKIRLNGASGTLVCTATGTGALTQTLGKKNLSCTTTADIPMSASDRFYLWVGVNLTATSTTAFNGELDVEGTLNGNFDSQVVIPLATPAPTITSLAPNTGSVGAVVVISGANFRNVQGSSTVTFNGTPATVAKAANWTPTSITVPVPTGATTGPVVVTVGGQATPGVTFYVTGAPQIDSLAPDHGAVGSVVAVPLANYGPTQGNGFVTFSGKKPAITSWSPTNIVLTVPSGTASGNVVVTAAGGIASNAVAFTVTPAPSITSLTPASGGFGSSFTIAGTSFGATQGSGLVTLNGVPCTITGWSDTSIVALVPSGVTTGDVVVTAAGGVSSNGVRFQVLNPGGVAVDQIVFTTATGAATTRATAAFSTTSTNELLLAFVATSRSTAANPVVNSISGGG